MWTHINVTIYLTKQGSTKLDVEVALDVCRKIVEIDSTGTVMSGLIPWLSLFAVIIAALIAALVATSSSKKVHLLEKKRDVILEITNEVADLRNYVIEKAISEPPSYHEDSKSQVKIEMLQITGRLVRAIDKFYVISSDSNSAQLEALYLELIKNMTLGIEYHFNPNVSYKDVLNTSYLLDFNSLRADIIEILNDELNDKKITLTAFKDAIKATNKAASSMLK